MPRLPRRLAGVGLALALFAAVPDAAPQTAAQQSAASAGATLRGRVEVRRVRPAPERRPGVSDFGSAAPREVADRRRAVVYLESAPRGAFDDREPVKAQLDQRRETFVPSVLAIMAGTTVDFPNNDAIYHNVFSLSRTKRFDLGRYAQGRSKSVRFDRPGIVRVFCDIHSHMSAYILVFSHPYFATTDAEGRYRIDQIPGGTYTVITWHDGDIRDTRTLTIPGVGLVEHDVVIP